MATNTAGPLSETSTPPEPTLLFQFTDEDLALLRAAMSEKAKEREADILVFYRELPRLLAQGQEGRFALIQSGKIVSLWDTHNDAIQAGYDKFGPEHPFMTPDITQRELGRLKAFLAQTSPHSRICLEVLA